MLGKPHWRIQQFNAECWANNVLYYPVLSNISSDTKLVMLLYLPVTLKNTLFCFMPQLVLYNNITKNLSIYLLLFCIIFLKLKIGTRAQSALSKLTSVFDYNIYCQFISKFKK